MENNTPEIIFEDENILVVNKPCGMIVNKADTAKSEFTLQDWVQSKCIIYNVQCTIKNEFNDRSGIVHRLDKDTSGVILIAKNEKTFIQLQEQFKNRTVHKEYNALVHGIVMPSSGIINAPIERNPFNRKRFGIFPGGREAVTEYKTILNSPQRNGNREEYTLLKLKPHTGRTHQIRVHLKYLGYPIVSDILYGGRKNIKSDLKFCPRMFLHARKIEFIHPVTNSKVGFEADLPLVLQEVLKSLEKQ